MDKQPSSGLPRLTREQALTGPERGDPFAGRPKYVPASPKVQRAMFFVTTRAGSKFATQILTPSARKALSVVQAGVQAGRFERTPHADAPQTCAAPTRVRLARGRERRDSGRRQQRHTARSTSSADSGPSDLADDPEPPRLRLWWHPVWGRCSPGLLRVLGAS